MSTLGQNIPGRFWSGKEVSRSFGHGKGQDSRRHAPPAETQRGLVRRVEQNQGWVKCNEKRTARTTTTVSFHINYVFQFVFVDTFSVNQTEPIELHTTRYSTASLIWAWRDWTLSGLVKVQISCKSTKSSWKLCFLCGKTYSNCCIQK